ncbi:hypothetical protein HY988_01895 [Candidatus Micrarchaeota archaeon]|nr:hypothetical protein [Candidatus Micrarchaeota archaeon]
MILRPQRTYPAHARRPSPFLLASGFAAAALSGCDDSKLERNIRESEVSINQNSAAAISTIARETPSVCSLQARRCLQNTRQIGCLHKLLDCMSKADLALGDDGQKALDRAAISEDVHDSFKNDLRNRLLLRGVGAVLGVLSLIGLGYLALRWKRAIDAKIKEKPPAGRKSEVVSPFTDFFVRPEILKYQGGKVNPFAQREENTTLEKFLNQGNLAGFMESYSALSADHKAFVAHAIVNGFVEATTEIKRTIYKDDERAAIFLTDVLFRLAGDIPENDFGKKLAIHLETILHVNGETYTNNPDLLVECIKLVLFTQHNFGVRADLVEKLPNHPALQLVAEERIAQLLQLWMSKDETIVHALVVANGSSFVRSHNKTIILAVAAAKGVQLPKEKPPATAPEESEVATAAPAKADEAPKEHPLSWYEKWRGSYRNPKTYVHHIERIERGMDDSVDGFVVFYGTLSELDQTKAVTKLSDEFLSRTSEARFNEDNAQVGARIASAFEKLSGVTIKVKERMKEILDDQTEGRAYHSSPELVVASARVLWVSGQGNDETLLLTSLRDPALAEWAFDTAMANQCMAVLSYSAQILTKRQIELPLVGKAEVNLPFFMSKLLQTDLGRTAITQAITGNDESINKTTIMANLKTTILLTMPLLRSWAETDNERLVANALDVADSTTMPENDRKAIVDVAFNKGHYGALADAVLSGELNNQYVCQKLLTNEEGRRYIKAILKRAKEKDRTSKSGRASSAVKSTVASLGDSAKPLLSEWLTYRRMRRDAVRILNQISESAAA